MITPIAAIAVLSVVLFFPRGQADSQLTVASGLSPLIEVEELEIVEEETIISVPTAPEPIVVDVQGAVTHPGVYSLVEGDRLIDAIHAAGGYLPHADSRMLNHAMKLVDEFYIYVPIEGEEVSLSGSILTTPVKEEDQKSVNKVNINLADMQELMTIPGIGPSKAAAIIQYRDENGSFTSTDRLMDVSGIGQKTFDRLESFVTVD
ncbi:helix-hairpin-helix domain-containing protein [Sporosarcina sp. Sa2YVA2]|uniref:Helix-hairpin-helix domain-containing protein n=1 Tax=Sporosarcina quadrami TaxID=2762234 RepID=A0ABR8U4Y4_9BACL|nr:helix-hairpin-helix domain-containing protein [Sporosarcina quadrami]